MDERFYRDLLLKQELLDKNSPFVQEEIKAQGESYLDTRGTPCYLRED